MPHYLLNEITIRCPYCAESMTILVDASVESQHYIEDCQVCCRPMQVQISTDLDGNIHTCLSTESDI